MNFREWGAPLFLTQEFIKTQVFEKLYQNPKNWIFILKDFEFLDIFIESKWGYSAIYIYVLKLMESKVKEDINKYV